jgi:hypothetical protein
LDGIAPLNVVNPSLGPSLKLPIEHTPDLVARFEAVGMVCEIARQDRLDSVRLAPGFLLFICDSGGVRSLLSPPPVGRVTSCGPKTSCIVGRVPRRL